MKVKNQYETVHGAIRPIDVAVTRRQHFFSVFDKDLVSPHLFIAYCHEVSSRLMYDVREETFCKGDLAVVMPEQVLNQKSCLEDFVFTRVVISAQLYAELRSRGFDYDYDKYHLPPICKLSDERAAKFLKIVDLIEDISSFYEEDLQLRHTLLLSQLTVGYEFIYYHFREQVRQRGHGSHEELFNHFCRLVVEHYRESREMKYYAGLLNLTPKHFSKVIREETGGLSPACWIEQYVVAQAKRYIENSTSLTLGEIAYLLGFPDPTTFYRFFKRVTGLTAKQYREAHKK